MKKIIKFVCIGLFAFISCVTLASCEALGLNSDVAVTTESNVKPENRGEAVEIPLSQLPASVRSKFEGSTDKVVVVPDRSILIDPTKAVGQGSSFGDVVRTVGGVAFEAAKAFIPGLAVWEGVLSVFSQRKRDHYKDAIKSLVPYDGAVDLTGTVTSLAKAIGGAHSDADTKAVWNEEKVAVKGSSPTPING